MYNGMRYALKNEQMKDGMKRKRGILLAWYKAREDNTFTP